MAEINEETVLLNFLGLSRNDFKIITDPNTFKSILQDMHRRGELDAISYNIINDALDLPFAEITLPFGEDYYIYLGSDVKNDIFTLYHAIGHVYLYKKLGLFINFIIGYRSIGSCSEDDIKMEASFLIPVRNIVEDILADTTIYSALSRISNSRAEEYWVAATRDIDKALDKLKTVMIEKFNFIDLYTYASMLAESVYKQRAGLTRRTTEKLRSYTQRPGLQEALELLNSIVDEMRASTSYTIATQVARDKRRTRTIYRILVEAVAICINLKQ